ncbi:MAG: amidohydrolase family protein, partial [Candidatus Cloacimonetes bacterium]|nr:amidohydrolase family protein [Candidatus Cloacimonadota bacterium]
MIPLPNVGAPSTSAPSVDLIITNAGQLLTLKGKTPRQGKQMNDLSIITDGAIAIQDRSIIAVGTSAEINSQYNSDNVIDAKGGVVMPGFVDAHTHLVFGRTREDEFARRLKGEDYVVIAKAGGGIKSTIKSTRETPADKLYD